MYSRYYNEKFRLQEAALNIALAAIDKRLEGMNEFRASLSDQTRLMMTRTEVVSITNPISDRLTEALKPNYTMYGVLMTMLIGTTGAAWVVMGLLIANSNIPLALDIATAKVAHANQELKIKELGELINSSKADRVKDIAEIRVQLAHIEDKLKKY